jgi:hypothetical protein
VDFSSSLSVDKVIGISYIIHTDMDIGRTRRIFRPSMINGLGPWALGIGH